MVLNDKKFYIVGGITMRTRISYGLWFVNDKKFSIAGGITMREKVKL